MSLDQQTGKHRQTKGKKYCVNLDDDTQGLFLLTKQVLEEATGDVLTNTDTFKWLIINGAASIEQEIERTARQLN